jgi:hypothetical protein
MSTILLSRTGERLEAFVPMPVGAEPLWLVLAVPYICSVAK